MRYLPHTPEEIREMLRVVGIPSSEKLFESIPEGMRLKRPLNLPHSLSEIELRNHLRDLSRENAHGEDWVSLLGAGAYAHYIPSAVSQLTSRGEFLTAYTPYQPEVSQGTLQAIFEYQTMTAEILGMEISNASLYDGSTGTAEAALMAARVTERPRILVARSVHPEYRHVLETYSKNLDTKLEEIPFNKDGTIDQRSLKLDEQVAAIIVSVPNFFGVIEDLSDLAEAVHRVGGLFVVVSPEPLAFGLFRPPGEIGADIAVAEGTAFGNPQGFGGPSLGMFATHKKFARSIPGRIVGETTDGDGNTGYVLTLATREQHIRRERATSNICTNVSLCALAAAITLSLWGEKGFERLARINYARAERLKKNLALRSGYSLPFPGTTFNEFVVRPSRDPVDFLQRLRAENILGGIPLSKWYPELDKEVLICLTEMTPDDHVQRLLEALED